MANKNNVHYAQLHIKSFNKYLSRHLESVTDLQYEVITDLIGENLTRSGFGKAGAKFLQQLSDEELQSYLADIDAAKQLMMQDEIIADITKDYLFSDDPKAGLWKMYQLLEDMGYPFDSSQIKEIVDGDVKADYRSTIIEMGKMITDDYGVSDFTEWYNKQPRLE